MTGVRDELGHELAALLSLVDSIVAPCDLPAGSVAYTSASEDFRSQIIELSHRTKRYLNAFSDNENIDEGEEDFGSAPSELKEIKSVWKELHPYIKPAMQADTLHQPTSLVNALTDRFREIKDFENTTFTIFHAEEFNYLHLYPAEIARVTSRLSRLVAAGEFPEFVLIGIPSSQASALFINCLIAHEMGHYVAAKKGFLTRMLGEAETALKLVLKEEYPTGRGSFELPAKLAKWAEELFCDLFAVQLLGPCYTFAFIELYDLLQQLRLDGTLHPERTRTAQAFFIHC